MPAYPGAPGAIVPVTSNVSGFALNPGDSAFLVGVLAAGATQLPIQDNNVDFEEAPVGMVSISACIAGRKEAGSAPAVSLQLIFEIDPGAFNVQLQEASTDADGCYLTPSAAAFTITSATNTGGKFVAFVDDIPTGGRFLRILVKLNPNDADLIAKLSLLA